MKKTYIGAIDQGTTSTRFLLFNRKGQITASHQLEHRQIFPKPGWVEHDPMSIWENTQKVIKAAMQEAGAQLREPIVDLEVYATQDYMGDLSSDISTRRGRVAGMEAGVIRAKVPMAELYQYSASLKSITSGAGTYTMTFSHYDAVPAHIAQKVIDEATREKEEKEHK